MTNLARKLTDETLQDKTVCAEIRCSVIGTRRRVSTSQIETDADRTMVHVGKDILDSDDLCAIRNLDQKLRLDLNRVAVQSRLLRGGIYIVPIALIETVEQMVSDAQAERARLVDKFLDAYPSLVAIAKTKLGSLYDPTDYPSVETVRAAFRMTFNYVSLNVPDSLQGISGALFERERVKAERKWAEAAQEIRDALRESFKTMVAHLAAKLADNPDGSRNRLHESSVAKFESFLELFEKRDVTNDDDLRKLVTKARKIMKGVNVDDLRSDEDVRNVTRAAFDTLLPEIDKAIVKSGRRIRFED